MQTKILFKGFLKGQFKEKIYLELWIDADLNPLNFTVQGSTVWLHTNSKAKIDKLRSHRDYEKAMSVHIERENVFSVTFTKKLPDRINCKSEFIGRDKDILQITIYGEVLG